MKTPCVAKCKNNDGICSGCLRTMKEVVEWQAFDDQTRETIMQEIKGQPTTHQCPQCGKPASCDISAGKSTCWCFELDKRDTIDCPSGACLCRECLSKQPLA
ncbi:DUF1289 domain-containing protein [Photobacterium leiognathi]|uniref:DUF1289 domain-containing protein n=1 Tax=Photobacterium leiognathi TaxID=553611 RepID=UPI002736878E|nr:DUF1289 domain-containing protein [Photobacterium leiognathi]